MDGLFPPAMTKKWYRRGTVLVSAVALILLCLFASCYLHDSLLEQRFERVTQGMQQQQVRSVLGEPDRVGPCGEVGGVPPAGCAREYLYYPKLPTITTWAVFLDEHGTVLDTYRFESP